jgi:DNA-binding CsgD family transcriptional regulator
MSCGAVPTAERARLELQERGADILAAAPAGIDALTAGERRLAALAADGRSSREIAQALFVTPKVVEDRLARTYEKLGITTAAQLADALTG